jgi:hypothetical protein
VRRSRKPRDQRQDAPLGLSVSRRGSTVEQILSHTTTTGSYRYDPSRYADLGPVVEQCGSPPDTREACLRRVRTVRDEQNGAWRGSRQPSSPHASAILAIASAVLATC